MYLVAHSTLRRALVKQSSTTNDTCLSAARNRGYSRAIGMIAMPRSTTVANIVLGDESGSVELHWAVVQGDEVTVRLLLENGVDISAKDEEGRTALHVAARGGQEALVKLLLEKNADIHVKDHEGWPALFFAIGQGNMAVVQLLLGDESDIIQVDNNGIAALQVAAMVGRPEVAGLLLQKGVKIDMKDRFGWTALHRASSNGRMAVIQVLLERGAGIAAVTEQGSSALHVAAEMGKNEVAQFLLESGADIEAKSREGWTVLHRTADSGHEATAQLLLERGANIFAKDDHGATALHRAAGRGHVAMVQLLLEKGADLTARDISGFTPLRVATATKQRRVVQLLLQKGADVNSKDDIKGWTPMHSAAFYGHEAILNLLLENDADFSLTDKDNCTALDYAIDMEDRAVIKLLLEAVPGLTDLVNERGIGRKDADEVKESRIEQQFAALDMGLDHLCDICSKVCFPTLHDKEQCASVGCNYHISSHEISGRPFSRERLEDHSIAFKHHPSRDALCIAAQKGCHLCSLIAFGLQHSYEHLTIAGRETYSYDMEKNRYGAAQGGVVLVYHKSSEWVKKEELEIFCGDLFTILPITNSPQKRCFEPGFSEAGWDVNGGGQANDDLYGLGTTKAMFYARCVRPNHPTWGYRDWSQVDASRIGGFPRIESYMPGQVVSVYAVRGRLWLVGFLYGIPAALAAHHAGHLTFGWVESADYIRLSQAPHPSCDCGKGVWEPPLLSTVGGGQTAYLSDDVSTDATLSVIERWISSCADNHSICRPSDPVCLPLRVIDVGAPEIEGTYPDPFLSVGSNRPGRYATLSYRWGDGLTLKTTSSTFEWKKASMPLGTMPQTFQDAVNVTRRLGIRYLWIDALCIIQDSSQDWQEQSALMAQIYGDAWLNISVSKNSDPLSGFLKKRNILEIRSCRHPTLFGDLIGSNGAAGSFTKVICPNVPRHDRLLDRDVINSRGWILQERILSKGTIHFGLHEIYWECLSRSAWEREPEAFELWSNASNFDMRSQQRRKLWNVIRCGLKYLEIRVRKNF